MDEKLRQLIGLDINSSHARPASENGSEDCQSEPQQPHRAALWQAACETSCSADLSVAKEQATFEWFVEALHYYDDDQAGQLLTDAWRQLPAAAFQSLLERSALCSNSRKLTILTCEQLSAAQKEQLIAWMLDPGCWPTPVPTPSFDLCEMASPLQTSVNNPEVKYLEMAAIKAATHWTPPRYNVGRQLLGEIGQVISAAAVERPSLCEPLFQARGNTVGGRTFKIDQGEQALYYKFQRKGESLKTLMQEGAVHTVRERHPELFGPLHSKLPGDARFFRLYLNQLPTVLPRFDDPVAIEKDEDGQHYVHVYRYVAANGYSVYAHKADHSHPDNPYQKGEQGILAACHDIGLLTALGLVPTSTLPAFHDSQREREWMALHPLFVQGSQKVYPGTLGAWNSVATEQCDFGYGGFRDVGDFEPFGDIESFLNKVDAQTSVQVPELEQCLCLVNAVCENLLAAHLIRARLRQSGSDYHYKNPEARKQNQAFIEQSLLSFLQGMYGDRIQSDSAHCFLLERLEIDESGYKRWLARAALETLYWTAKQPDPEQPDQPPFKDTSPAYSHKDGYALHLNRTGRLAPDLYPTEGNKEAHALVYPHHFHNCNGQLNLGSHNAVFPLTTLMRGLTRLCTGLLAYHPTGMDLSSE